MLPQALTRQAIAAALGTETEAIVSLSQAAVALGPEHLDFLGLLQARVRQEPTPDAVVLSDEQPLLYIWDLRHEPDFTVQERRRDMERLSLRADAPYVAFLRPGVVQVYALGHAREDEAIPVLEDADLHPGLLARLAVGDVPSRVEGISTHELMLELLNVVTDTLIEHRGRNADEALALMGRALFLRFLHDRGILPDLNPLPGVPRFSDCFGSPHWAAASSRWLDETFNGDLLTLPEHGSLKYFQALGSGEGMTALDDLSAIIQSHKPVGDGAYQTQFSWGDLHFAYIPVGLLSQVYEAHIHRFQSPTAKEESVYYTPRHLAEYAVDQALGMLGDSAHTARVLDPAAGGGVFLLAAFRRLVQARWRATGVQPTTSVIRSILNTQLVGMDINPAARQMSALALYLTALELDPEVALLQNLTFEALQGKVLVPTEEWIDAESGQPLGSLSHPDTTKYAGAFDLVIGNPPWTSLPHAKRQRAMDRIARSAMVERGVEPVANPDGVPDLPFVWQSTQWAAPGAVIAFALHARLLIKTTPLGLQARRAVFKGLDVSYVLNGMELRGTPVWPGNAAYFCLIFARNQAASDNAQFYAVTPSVDRALNAEGRIRIDHKDAWASDVMMVEQVPTLFKTLAKGNSLDVSLLEKIQHAPPSPRRAAAEALLEGPALRPTLEKYATEVGIEHGQGYQTSSESEPADFLIDMPVMPDPRDAEWFVIPTAKLYSFSLKRVHRTRRREIYKGPMVLLRKSPSTKPHAPAAMLALKSVAYRESYFGYSCAKTTQPQLMAVYMWALMNSRLFLYYALMTSSIFGCEREALQKSDVDQFPIVPLTQLSKSQIGALESMLELAKKKSPELDLTDVDGLVNRIYGLTPADVMLVEDRLAVALPFSRVKKAAVSPPKQNEVQAYGDALVRILEPFDLSDSPLQVTAYPHSPLSPWRFLRVGAVAQTPDLAVGDLVGSLRMADDLDCTLVEYHDSGALYLGILNQRRYWTRTAARTLALDLIKRNAAILNRGAGSAHAS
ncbi:MAG: N-6 DNA methylase [Stenotrophomonas nitritireducens]|uniref:N-6 DNA methylase n=1 Tax=Stenotrophomonas nitritireducens TaxID=83617 RepID=UPI001AD527C2|nr:N-6 DNA methylase [Stenotrophomonas nitritireducens]MBN8791021.1 N-6 DNA methylase [Stenotrophomonas nitritireducens]MBN8796591.1 N-6 DNA methylase [Stenotrophomonas nitritireducens]